MSESNCGMCNGKPRELVKWVTMCIPHQEEVNVQDARRAGIPDVVTNIDDPTLMTQMREKLKTSKSGYIVVQVRP